MKPQGKRAVLLLCVCVWVFFRRFLVRISKYIFICKRNPERIQCSIAEAHIVCTMMMMIMVSQWAYTGKKNTKKNKHEKQEKKKQLIKLIDAKAFALLSVIFIGRWYIYKKMSNELMKFRALIFGMSLCYCTRRSIDHRYTSTTRCLRI